MQFNPRVCNTEFPPVTEAAGWIAGRTFPDSLPLIDVSQAVPGYASSEAITQHMAELVQQPAIAKYGHVLGYMPLREAYAVHLNDRTVGPDNIAITAGCNQAFYVAVAALCGTGDQIILPSPWYFNHKMSLDMLGIEAVALPCDPTQHMIPDVEHAAKLINTKTRAIVLISPNNPTGQVYPSETIDQFYSLSTKTGIPLIVDETYCDFRSSPDTPAHHIFTQPDWHEHAIHLYSFSKTYALAGYRVGALAGSTQLLREVTKVLDCIAICAPQIAQHAALFGLQNADEWKEQKRQLMYARADAFAEVLSASDQHAYEVAAMGAYFAYLKHPFQGLSATAVAKYLANEANLLALPGEMFGPDQENYLRVAFANVSRNVMPDIAQRLANFRPAT